MADERDELDEVMDRAYNGEYALGLLMVKARSIRARERKLAELAREMCDRLEADTKRDGFPVWTLLEFSDWLRRYEEAVKL